MKLLLFIYFFLLPASALIAQTGQINIRKYTIEDGMVNNDILNIYQDSRGFLWICTRGGLSRYDGSRFTNFTPSNGLVNDMINDIYETAPQEFIVAQNSGGPIFLKNDRIVAFEPANKMVINEFIPAGNGRLLVATDYHGVMEWNKGGFKPFYGQNNSSVHRVIQVNDSSWLAVDLNYSTQLITPSQRRLAVQDRVVSLTAYKDSKQRTWLGTNSGLKLIDPAIKLSKTVSLLPLPAPFDIPGLRDVHIFEIMEDSQGNMWFGTFSGLVKVANNGESYVYTQQDGLPASMINCIKEDKQNNIWVGTPLGLAKLKPGNTTNTFVLSLGLIHEGNQFVSPVSKNRLLLFDGKKISDLYLPTGKHTKNSLIDTGAYLLYKMSEDELMIKRGKTALVFKTGSDMPEPVHWPDSVFTAIIRVGPDRFIASNFGSIFSVVHGRCKELVKIDKASTVHRFAIGKNNVIWAGTYTHGLIKLNMTGTGDSLQLQIARTFTDSLPDLNVRSLYADKENEVWIGTRYKGVTRLVELPNGKIDMQTYGTSKGLSSDFIHSINRDPRGNVWIGTAQGPDKLIPEGNRYRVFNFGKVNNVFSKIYDIDFLDSNYLLVNGYPSLVYARDMEQDGMPPLPVYITKISGSPSDTASFTFSKHAQLPYNKAQIYFEFSAPQFINEDFTKYSYRLLGTNDTAWVNTGNLRSVSFASLSPGNYTFQVRTMGFNGAWGNAAIYQFNVNAPFWQKAWFILLAVFACGLLIYILYRYRVQQIIHVQKVRNRIATDLHDEIGSNLTNISILSNLSKNNLLQPHKAGDFLQRISEEVSSSSQALDDIIWSVDTSHDTLEETVARMRRYAAELFDAANTSYDLYLDAAFESKRLTMEQRRDLYLLYKEAVNNISKHAAANHVSIQIAIEHNQLVLSVKDDGHGFDMNHQSSRHGLKGMQQRVKRWKGKITIDSGKGRGTFIQVSLPVSK